MTCRKLRRLETEYIDGVLAQFQADAVRGHLARCRACKERLAELVGTLRALRETTAPLPPSDLYARIMQATDEPRPWLERARERAAAWTSDLARLAMGPGLATLCVAGFMAFSTAMAILPDSDGELLEPEAGPLVSFANQAHDDFQVAQLTVVASVESSGAARIRAISTPGDVYLSPGAPDSSAHLVVLVFERISVVG